MLNKAEIEKIEIDLFLDAIFKRYGYDFRHYAKASIGRRIRNLLKKTDFKQISEMIPKLLNDESFFDSIAYDFSITVTEMFRDPDFFLALREKVFPYLRTYPFMKIWHAGCATGEEVYSLAILLQEEGLYDHVTIYATDINNAALQKAKDGIYPLKDMRKFTANYQKSGGKNAFSDYYYAQYQSAIMEKSLKNNITFANHNLVTDGVFGEMNLILCRNVLIYFDKTLQARVHELFDDCLTRGGFLALGNKETLQFSNIEKKFKITDRKNKIFQKTV